MLGDFYGIQKIKPIRSSFTTDLHLHHFAYLRAIAEGLPRMESALRYLGIAHGSETISAHRAVTDRARAHVCRLGDPRWRLIGIEIQDREPLVADAPPSLGEWAESNGLSEFSERELQELYTERFPPQGEETARRNRRNERLRTMRLALLRQLESMAFISAAPSHPLDGWLSAQMAAQLRIAGLLTVGDLTQQIARGGRWWRAIPGFGTEKASRLTQLIMQLASDTTEAEIPDWSILARPLPPHLQGQASQSPHDQAKTTDNSYSTPAASASQALFLRHSGSCKIEAQHDAEALGAWIRSCGKSVHTRAQYQRETERLWLYCLIERKIALSAMTEADCSAYIRFLHHIPHSWISNRRSARLSPGWAPFKGELSPSSATLSVQIVSGLFNWWFKVGYIRKNPWRSTKTAFIGSVQEKVRVNHPSSAAGLSASGWQQLTAHLDATPPSVAHDRLRWLCQFAPDTGLRPAQLAMATRAQLYKDATGNWYIHAHPYTKYAGSARPVAVSARAIAATRRYFQSRGLSFDDADPHTPLFSAIENCHAAVSVQGMSVTFRRYIKSLLKSRKVFFGDADRTALARLSVDDLRQLRH